MPKYWKTTVTTIVLTEADVHPNYESWGSGLESVTYDITEGHASGVSSYVYEEVTEDEMQELLIGQRSDPDFLIQDEDIDDESEQI